MRRSALITSCCGARGLLLGFRQCVIGRAPILRSGLVPRFLQQRDGRIGFAQPALLQEKILLQPDQFLVFGEIDDLRSQCLFDQSLADVDALLQHRYRRLQLRDARRSGRPLRFLLALLAFDLGELGILFGALADQELTMHLDLRGACALRRPEGGKRILCERRTQPRDVELGRDEIALLAFAVGFRHGRIEFDQNVAGLYALPVADVDGANNARLERLDQLGAPARHDLAGRGRDDIDAAERRPRQREAEHRDDARADRAPDRRRRRFSDLERRRQERDFLLAAASRNRGFRKRDDISASGRHGYRPADNGGLRNARSSGSAHHGCRPRRCGHARCVMIRFALRTVESRWAMTNTVRPAAISLHVLLDGALAFVVERAGRLVEDQDARVGDQRARDRDALALPARQAAAAFADDGVVALGQLQDEVVRAGERRRRR